MLWNDGIWGWKKKKISVCTNREINWGCNNGGKNNTINKKKNTSSVMSWNVNITSNYFPYIKTQKTLNYLIFLSYYRTMIP